MSPTCVSIHTDGSCLGNPGPGGWAAHLVYKETVRLISGGFALTTNNRMELYAALQGLAMLKRPCHVELYTDSRYLCDAVEKGWLYGWQRKGWVKADRKPVANKDLWEQLLQQLTIHKVHINWIRGHTGHVENELVDTEARLAASRPNLPKDTGFYTEC